jgi:hypothetical protein
MKHNKYPQNQKPAAGAGPDSKVPVGSTQAAADFTPSPDEVARRAYFSYVNTGSLPGHEVQHWLEAEKQLLDERNQTRVHGYHNPT